MNTEDYIELQKDYGLLEIDRNQQKVLRQACEKALAARDEKIEALQKEIEEQNDLLLDAFQTECSGENGYDHQCLSTWELIQSHLISAGKIKAEECYRK